MTSYRQNRQERVSSVFYAKTSQDNVSKISDDNTLPSISDQESGIPPSPSIIDQSPDGDEESIHPNDTKSTRSTRSTSSGVSSQKTSTPTVSLFSEPSKILSDAIGGLANYMNDVDAVRKSAAELRTLLEDQDPEVQSKAVNFIHDLARKEACRYAILEDPTLMSHLVQALSSPHTVKDSAGVLHKLSGYERGLRAIHEANGICSLIQVLDSVSSCGSSIGNSSSSLSSIPNSNENKNQNLALQRAYVITTLHNLLLKLDGAKKAVLNAGGLKKFIKMLQNVTDPKVLAIVIDCLRILVHGSSDHKLLLFVAEVPGRLVQIMESYNYEKLLWVTSRLLQSLSVCPKNKVALVKAEAVQVLTKHLTPSRLSPAALPSMAHYGSSPRLVEACLWTLRNLSDIAIDLEGLEDLLCALVRLLDSPEIDRVICSCDILSNLLCGSERNKMMVYDLGGVDALLRCLVDIGEDLYDSAIRCLRHITFGHPNAEAALNDFRLCDGIPEIANILINYAPLSITKNLNNNNNNNGKIKNCNFDGWQLLRVIIGLVANLATCPANTAPLREYGVVSRLLQLLNETTQQQNFDSVPNKDEQSLLKYLTHETTKSILNCLALLSKDYLNRCLIREKTSLLMTLYYHGSSNAVRNLALSVLAQFAAEDDEINCVVEQAMAQPEYIVLTDKIVTRKAVPPSIRNGRPEQNSEEDEEAQLSQGGHSDEDSDGGWQPIFGNFHEFDVPLNLGIPQDISRELIDKTELEFVDLFITDVVINNIVTETNRYAEQKIIEAVVDEKLSRGSRLNEWFDTNPNEIRVFLGVLIWMGLDKKPKLKDYWSKSPLYKNDISKCMPRNRFEILLRMLHFSDNEQCPEGDRLHKIQCLVDALNANSARVIVPEQNICIDETMIPFRGRLSFRQYLKGKSHKFGIKLYKICLQGGFTYHARVYCGRDKTTDGVPVAQKVVMEMIEPLLDNGRTLFADNWYNSIQLAEKLSDRSTHLVGTLRKDRRGLPETVVKAKLAKGQITGLQNNKVVVMKWRDKRDVLFISTKHTDEMIEVNVRSGGAKMKPTAIADYNMAKAFVDLSDQLSAYSNCLRRSLKWYRKLAV